MIDFHSHILPGIDDGAIDITESVEMAKKASLIGVETIIATPHFIYGDTKYSKDVVYKLVEQLNSELSRQNLKVNILPGQEIYLTPEVPRLLKEQKIIILGDKGKYLLVELPMNEYPAYTDNTLFEIMLQGVIPVIAHPERNRAFAKHPEMLYRLVEKGVLTQANVGSFNGKYGDRAKEAAHTFLKHNFTHFFGYDAHNIDGYSYELPSYTDIADNENKFLNGKIVTTNPKTVKKQKKFLGIF